MNMLPPAIALFSALLKQEGHEVDLFDTTYHRMESDTFDHDKKGVESLIVLPADMGEKGIYEKKTSAFDDLVDKMEAFKPDLIAMSTVEDTFLKGISLLEHISHYKIPSVVGGVFPTFAPEKVIAYDCVDMVAIGEGENILIELCRRMKSGEDYSNIPGLWVKTKKGITKNPMGDYYDFDSLPVLDFSIFEEARLYRIMIGVVYRMIPVETHRGCIYQCTFCNSPAQNSLYRKELGKIYFRKLKASKISEQLHFYKDHWNAEYFYFTANTFLAWTNKEFDQFIELYSDIKLPFWCQTRPETINSYRMKRLKDVGLHRMSIGCEHGNEEFRRKVIGRNIGNQEIIRAFECAYDHGVSITVNNIIGLPDETRELAFDTIELTRKLKVDSIKCAIFTPFHGTKLRKLAVERGYLDDSTLGNCLLDGSIMNMPKFPSKQISALMETFNLYARFEKERWPDIEKVERNLGSHLVKDLHDELKQEYRTRFLERVSDD